jgi:hypothetical protein
MPAVIATACPGMTDGPACYSPDTNTIYVRQPGFAFQHELGHAFDAANLDDGERSRFIHITHLRGPWRQGTGFTAGGLRSPSEKFADAYAACRLRLDPRREWETGYDWTPSPRLHRRVCAFISRAAD